MIKEFTRSIPEKVKVGLDGARVSLANIRTDLRGGFERLSMPTISREEFKKRFTQMQKKAASTFEKTVSENLKVAYGALNIPTKTEVDAISKRVNKINAEIRRLVEVKTSAKTAAKTVHARKNPRRANGKPKTRRAR